MGIGIFVSGPSRASALQEQEMIQTIETKSPEIKNVYRHVFRYIVYVGERDGFYLFFNEKGEQISSRKKHKENEQKVILELQNKYHMLDFELKVGYGIEGPVYTCETKQGIVLLDYDSLKEVYYLKKGDS